MPIIQINFWQCEMCGVIFSNQKEVSPYSDPIVNYPTTEKWGYVGKGFEEELACPNCLKHYREIHEAGKRTSFLDDDDDWIGTADSIIHRKE